MNSKQKGKRGELEASHALQDLYGFETRRSQQYCGSADSADVVGLSGIHLEVKRAEKLNIDKAMEQAIGDSLISGNVPTVLHRRNGKDWLVTVRLSDLERFARAFIGNLEKSDKKNETR